MYEMAEGYKERHYKGDYIWCDRYTGFKTLENGLERKNYVKNRKNIQHIREYQRIDVPIQADSLQEGYCCECQIYLDWQKPGERRSSVCDVQSDTAVDDERRAV